MLKLVEVLCLAHEGLTFIICHFSDIKIVCLMQSPHDCLLSVTVTCGDENNIEILERIEEN